MSEISDYVALDRAGAAAMFLLNPKGRVVLLQAMRGATRISEVASPCRAWLRSTDTIPEQYRKTGKAPSPFSAS